MQCSIIHSSYPHGVHCSVQNFFRWGWGIGWAFVWKSSPITHSNMHYIYTWRQSCPLSQRDGIREGALQPGGEKGSWQSLQLLMEKKPSEMVEVSIRRTWLLASVKLCVLGRTYCSCLSY